MMGAAFVVVLVPACDPAACCICFCRRHIPALASALCLTPVGVLIKFAIFAVPERSTDDLRGLCRLRNLRHDEAGLLLSC